MTEIRHEKTPADNLAPDLLIADEETADIAKRPPPLVRPRWMDETIVTFIPVVETDEQLVQRIRKAIPNSNQTRNSPKNFGARNRYHSGH